MKTKDEIKQQASEKFHESHPQLSYTNTQVDWMFEQYSDQNTAPLVECLKELSYLRASKLSGVSLSESEERIEMELWVKAKELISKYDS